MTYLVYEDLDHVFYCSECGVLQSPDVDQDADKYLEVCHNCGVIFESEMDYASWSGPSIKDGE